MQISSDISFYSQKELDLESRGCITSKQTFLTRRERRTLRLSLDEGGNRELRSKDAEDLFWNRFAFLALLKTTSCVPSKRSVLLCLSKPVEASALSFPSA